MEKTKYAHCVDCGEEFSGANVHSVDGALETQISGLCEDCFGAIFEDMDEYE